MGLWTMFGIYGLTGIVAIFLEVTWNFGKKNRHTRRHLTEKIPCEKEGYGTVEDSLAGVHKKLEFLMAKAGKEGSSMEVGPASDHAGTEMSQLSAALGW